MKKCSVDGCDNKHFSLSYCRPHYHRERRHGNPLAGGPPKSLVHVKERAKKGEPEAFLNYALTYSSDDCLLWPYSRERDIYPQILIDLYGTGRKTNERTSRVVLILTQGLPPTSKHETCHLCGINRCVNPKHLKWATHSENMKLNVLHGKIRCSTERQREDILREIADGGNIQEISERYGFTVRTIRRWIKNYKQ